MFRRFVLEKPKTNTKNVSVRKRRHKTETRKLLCGNSANGDDFSPFLLHKIERHRIPVVQCFLALGALHSVDKSRKGVGDRRT